MLNQATASGASRQAKASHGPRYHPPANIRQVAMATLLASAKRGQLADKQLTFLRGEQSVNPEIQLYVAGDLSLLERPCVAIVGSRDVSDQGRIRARRLARELVEAGIVVVSGLAHGVDTAAHEGAISAGGSTIGVIGTPLDRAYPAENARLQEHIHQSHLLISPFAAHEKTHRSNFPKRNRVMAALSDATVIVEASDTSGSLHQAVECVRLGRWLFIARSLADNSKLEWPKKFLKEVRTAILDSTNDVIERVMAERE